MNIFRRKIIKMIAIAAPVVYIRKALDRKPFPTYQLSHAIKLPEKSIIAEWKKAICDAGICFAFTLHRDHAWDWYKTSQMWDKNNKIKFRLLK